jgi:hypothetical protein
LIDPVDFSANATVTKIIGAAGDDLELKFALYGRTRQGTSTSNSALFRYFEYFLAESPGEFGGHAAR